MKDLSVERLTALEACKEGIGFVKAFNLTDYNLDDLDITGDWQDFVRWIRRNKDKVADVPVTYKSCITFNGKVVDPSTLEVLKAFNDNWYTKEYNDQGLLVKYTNSDDWWYTREYNDQGLLVKSTRSNDYWQEWEYNDQGLEIKYTNSYGHWYVQENNDQGLEVKYTDNSGYSCTREYNDQGRLVKYANNEGVIYNTENLPEGILCQVFEDTEVILSIKLK